VLSVLALSAMGVLAVSATATEPTRVAIDQTPVVTVANDVCAFPVTITSSQVGVETTFSDRNNPVARIEAHAVEQDVFTANGTSLTGLPYTFSVQVLFADGQLTHLYASGLMSKVPLPNGTVFLSAGRVDFTAHPGAEFLIVPDVGRSGDVAALCAALAP
jgi:hypothetical protein